MGAAAQDRQRLPARPRRQGQGAAVRGYRRREQAPRREGPCRLRSAQRDRPRQGGRAHDRRQPRTPVRDGARAFRRARRLSRGRGDSRRRRRAPLGGDGRPRRTSRRKTCSAGCSTSRSCSISISGSASSACTTRSVTSCTIGPGRTALSRSTSNSSRRSTAPRARRPMRGRAAISTSIFRITSPRRTSAKSSTRCCSIPLAQGEAEAHRRVPAPLVADYQLYGAGEAQSLIGRTLRLISGICARDPRQLLPQLVGASDGFRGRRCVGVSRRSAPARSAPGDCSASAEPHPARRRDRAPRGAHRLRSKLFACCRTGGSPRALTTGTIRLWDVTTGAETARLEGHCGGVNALCLLPDGRLASGSGDSTIRLWDVASGAETARLEGHHGKVSSPLPAAGRAARLGL